VTHGERTPFLRGVLGPANTTPVLYVLLDALAKPGIAASGLGRVNPPR